MMRAGLALAALLPLLACGPVSRAQAERECLSQARLAEHPRGSVGVGMDSTGKLSPTFDVTISSDYLQGRDPSQLYDNCVMRRSGEMPSRPYTSIPAQQ
jgi:hypothetical protein